MLGAKNSGAVDWPPAFIAVLLTYLDDATELCESSGFSDALSHVRLAARAAKDSIEEVNCSAVEAHLLRIEQAILKDAWPSSLGLSNAQKQQAQEFYYPVLADIRALKDAWRNHVMHNRAEYSADDADAILDHVKRLMTVLAKRVREV